MKLYKNKIPIVVSDLNEGWIRSSPSAPPATGAIPRDYAIDPVRVGDSPSAMTLIDPSEWDALYDAGEANQDSLEHLYLRGDQPAFQFLDQNGFPDCWCHSTAHAIMFDALKQNLPVTRLNAVGAATLMKQTNGGWCGLSMQFARTDGYPIIGTGPGEWPYQSRHGSDTAALRANMKLHRNIEDWYDLGKEVYDQTLTKNQLATCLFNNCPSPSDYNEFGHSMLSIRWVRTDYGWGPLTLNSWKDYGYYGLCVLVNRVPDSACSLRASTSSS